MHLRILANSKILWIISPKLEGILEK